ncbi:MAG: nucleotidyltransferase domain-containing protein [Balneolales bacterium]
MRLAGEEHKIIKEAILERDPLAKIYLYGSRTNDYARGGDIDILVISDKIKIPDKLLIKRKLFKELEDQKIDITVTEDTNRPFVKSVLQNAEPLS